MFEVMAIAASIPFVVVANWMRMLQSKPEREFYVLLYAHSFAIVMFIGGALYLVHEMKLFPQYQKEGYIIGGIAILAFVILHEFAAKRARWHVWDGWLGMKALAKLAAGCALIWAYNNKPFRYEPTIDFWGYKAAVVVGFWLLVVGFMSLIALIPRRKPALPAPVGGRGPYDDDDDMPYGNAAPAGTTIIYRRRTRMWWSRG